MEAVRVELTREPVQQRADAVLGTELPLGHGLADDARQVRAQARVGLAHAVERHARIQARQGDEPLVRQLLRLEQVLDEPALRDEVTSHPRGEGLELVGRLEPAAVQAVQRLPRDVAQALGSRGSEGRRQVPHVLVALELGHALHGRRGELGVLLHELEHLLEAEQPDLTARVGGGSGEVRPDQVQRRIALPRAPRAGRGGQARGGQRTGAQDHGVVADERVLLDQLAREGLEGVARHALQAGMDVGQARLGKLAVRRREGHGLEATCGGPWLRLGLRPGQGGAEAGARLGRSSTAGRDQRHQPPAPACSSPTCVASFGGARGSGVRLRHGIHVIDQKRPVAAHTFGNHGPLQLIVQGRGPPEGLMRRGRADRTFVVTGEAG